MTKQENHGNADSHLSILHRTSRIVSSGRGIDEMLQELVAITEEVTGCDACMVYLPDHETGDVVLRASLLPHAAEIGHVRLKMGEGVAGWVAEHKSVVALSCNAFSDARFKAFSSLIEDTYEALISIPLINGGEVIGVLNVHHRDAHVHAPSEISLLSFLGEQMGGAIAYSQIARENLKLQEEALQIKQQLEDRKLIERAKGILQNLYGLSEQESYHRLREGSRRHRKPVREIAQAVILVEELGL